MAIQRSSPAQGYTPWSRAFASRLASRVTTSPVAEWRTTTSAWL
jgi:hypothetical protein